jgi:hypothetical protein
MNLPGFCTIFSESWVWLFEGWRTDVSRFGERLYEWRWTVTVICVDVFGKALCNMRRDTPLDLLPILLPLVSMSIGSEKRLSRARAAGGAHDMPSIHNEPHLLQTCTRPSMRDASEHC